MPTIITHGLAGLGEGLIFSGKKMPKKFWLFAALAGALPDLDAVSFKLGISYNSIFGHRGLTHSLFFAIFSGFTISSLFFRENKLFSKEWWKLTSFFFAATATHGILDAFTDGGNGVAFFAPFFNDRIFFPVTPIEVAPISIRSFFSQWGASVLKSEIVWVWIPLSVTALLTRVMGKLKE